MENKINLPFEIINKILIMRPTHPIAKIIIKPIIKEYRIYINRSMWNGTFDEYIFNWYNEYGYKYEDDNWKESDDFEDENYEDFSSGIDYGTRYREEAYIESDSDSDYDSEDEYEVVIKYIKSDSEDEVDIESDSDSEEI
jgi:hypothetical protein